MKTPIKIVIVAMLGVAVIGAVALRKGKAPAQPKNSTATADTAARGQAPAVEPGGIAAAKLPRLIDLGADKCIPCRMMMPVLEELKSEYAGKLNVQFIDVWKNPEAGKPYGIKMIPTQIFFDSAGKELFRHVGFFGKEDILAKWKQLGVDLRAANSCPHPSAE
jgi:thioredoxin